jgi:shikimate kinase
MTSGGGGPIVLVGLMASGKTTVGRALAVRLGRTFFDSDAMIEARTGRTVAQIFETSGEPAFRALETEVLDAALDAVPPGVVAAAGGVVLSEANRSRLQRASDEGGIVVWLRAAPGLLASRVRPGDHRPLLATDPAATLRQMATDRSALYADVADVVVDVDGRPKKEIVAAVIEALTPERAAP